MRSRLLVPAIAALCIAAVLVPARAQDAAELMLRLDRLESENRKLNGQVETLSNQVRRLDEQLKRFQADVDFRFREGGKPAGSAPAPAAQPSAAGNRRSDAFDPSAHPAAPGAPRPIGAAPASPPIATAPRAPTGALPGDPGEPASLQPGMAGAAPANLPAAGSAAGDFAIAKAMLERGDYEAAEMAFREYLRQHPKDRARADAVFNIGESFYRRSRYREAAEQYLSVTTDHAKSRRAAEAMLKLGMALRGLGAMAEACGTYAEVGKKYPNASAAVKQAVERERKRAQCAA